MKKQDSAPVTGQSLPDIQKTRDQRGIAIDEVGVSNIRFPVEIPLRSGGVCRTVGTIAMRVSLDAEEKGTHMSRFMIALNERAHTIQPAGLKEILAHLLDYLNAQSAFLDLSFPVFLERQAPVTKMVGMLDFDVTIKAVLHIDGTYDEHVGVHVTAASLCPCSREISQYGAHNQRSKIDIAVRPNNTMVWVEDLIDIAEQSASCALFPVLKRPDEKYVTEHAYENPKFVEDIVRDVTVQMKNGMEAGRWSWFRVAVTNQESIHNHDAYARIERGTPSPYLGSIGA
jgi:GTP cyclohydrolase I